MTRNRHVITALVCIAFAMGMTLPPADLAAGDRDQNVQEVLDGWAEASGGRDRLEQVTTWRIKGKITMFGLEGGTDEWYTADGFHRLDLDLAGMFQITIVRTPEHCWFLDQNGKVSEQAGKDLQDEITGVYLSTFSHLVAGRTPRQIPLHHRPVRLGAHHLPRSMRHIALPSSSPARRTISLGYSVTTESRLG